MYLHNTLQIYYHSEPLGDTASLILFRPHRLCARTDSRGPAVRAKFITNSTTQTHNCHLVPLLHCAPFPQISVLFSQTPQDRERCPRPIPMIYMKSSVFLLLQSEMIYPVLCRKVSTERQAYLTKMRDSLVVAQAQFLNSPPEKRKG